MVRILIDILMYLMMEIDILEDGVALVIIFIQLVGVVEVEGMVVMEEMVVLEIQ